MPALFSLVGAHVSGAGGLLKAIPRAAEVGAEAIQIFVANPRGWAEPAPDPAGDAAFRDANTDARLEVWVHSPYLINFGSPSPDTLAKSRRALEFSLRRAQAIGASGVVMHAGSAVLGNRWDDAMRQVRENVLPILDAVPHPGLLIEPTAGGGGALASDAESTTAYLEVLGREDVALCLDTCHMHAAGHDLSSAESMTRVLRRYVRSGQARLVHVNDSRDPAGSKRDRHEALGRGTIGADAFAALFTSPATRYSSKIVETADADHADDIETLKKHRRVGVQTWPARDRRHAARTGLTD